ncbi:MAG: hypothetical protein JXQ73_09335 [Phycisphaerae bacterium]|nr:hypothetical protein [Phycisphaerae bacterium]
MFFQTPLQRVLRQWEKTGGRLSREMHKLREYPITKRKDAAAICRALGSARMAEEGDSVTMMSPLFALLSLFQTVGSEAAFVELSENGLPHLRRVLRDRMASCSEDEVNGLMLILKILAMYGREEDADLLVEAARAPLAPDGYLWSVVLGHVNHERPGWRKLCDGLRSPLPEGFLCIAYLDFVNDLAAHGVIDDHPFGSPEGVQKLQAWLADRDKDRSSYAKSAAAAIPYLPETSRTELGELGRSHPDVGVRMQAAWADAKIGDPDGIRQLVQWCLDLNHSSEACDLLRELGREDDIPDESLEPGFQAKAEMCSWLAHPNEFGRPPDEVALYDKRELFWPPTNDIRSLWLFKYTYNPADADEEPDTGIGMVGSVTFALFGESTADLSPEDVYGLHCCWELEANRDSRAPEKRSAQEGRRILAERNPGFT